MAIQFCKDCGNTLPQSHNKLVQCRCCERDNKIVTVSSSDRFPSKLRDKLQSNVHQLSQKEKESSMKVSSTPCPKCNAPDMKYAELQMRSADEGSTIFYFCTVCKYRYTEDN